MKRLVLLITLMMALLLSSECLAEKRNVPMGTTMLTLPVLSEYSGEIEYVFDFDNTEVPMATRFITGSEDGWYTFTVKNHNMHNHGWSLAYGLLTSVFQYNAGNPENIGEKLYSEYICTDSGKAGSRVFNIRLEPNTEYFLNFNAVSVKPGTVSFVIEYTGDEAGETMATAGSLPAGVLATNQMNAFNDVDTYKIPASGAKREVSFIFENRLMVDGLNFALYDSFKEKFLDMTLSQGQSELMSVTLEDNMDYFLVVSQTKNRRAMGRYTLGWCDGNNHMYGEVYTARESTCKEEGYKARKCTACGQEETAETIPLSEHTAGDMLVVKDATCENDGYSEQHCLVCNVLLAEEKILAYGHSEGKWAEITAATCTAAGERALRCTVCEATLSTEIIAAFGHSEGEWMEYAASCTNAGKRVEVCSRCSTELQSEVIPATGHQYSEWVVVKEATMKETGEEERHCVLCGDTASRVIEKLGLFEWLFGK